MPLFTHNHSGLNLHYFNNNYYSMCRGHILVPPPSSQGSIASLPIFNNQLWYYILIYDVKIAMLVDCLVVRILSYDCVIAYQAILNHHFLSVIGNLIIQHCRIHFGGCIFMHIAGIHFFIHEESSLISNRSMTDKPWWSA